MATIAREVALKLPADEVWARLKAVDRPHELFAGVLTKTDMKGEIRTVSFANGMVVNERIMGIDDARMRVAYSVIEGPFSLHGASMQVLPRGEAECLLVWFSDIKPDGLEDLVAPLMDQGMAAVKRTLEGQ